MFCNGAQRTGACARLSVHALQASAGDGFISSVLRSQACALPYIHMLQASAGRGFDPLDCLQGSSSSHTSDNIEEELVGMGEFMNLRGSNMMDMVGGEALSRFTARALGPPSTQAHAVGRQGSRWPPPDASQGESAERERPLDAHTASGGGGGALLGSVGAASGLGPLQQHHGPVAHPTRALSAPVPLRTGSPTMGAHFSTHPRTLPPAPRPPAASAFGAPLPRHAPLGVGAASEVLLRSNNCAPVLHSPLAGALQEERGWGGGDSLFGEAAGGDADVLSPPPDTVALMGGGPEDVTKPSHVGDEGMGAADATDVMDFFA